MIVKRLEDVVGTKGDAHGTDMFRTASDLQQEITDWFGFWLLR